LYICCHGRSKARTLPAIRYRRSECARLVLIEKLFFLCIMLLICFYHTLFNKHICNQDIVSFTCSNVPGNSVVGLIKNGHDCGPVEWMRSEPRTALTR